MDKYIQLAKEAVEAYVSQDRKLEVPDGLPSEFLERKAGAFVTIYNGKDLRGCIGTFLATRDSLAQEIIDNAISACSRDNRFLPIMAEELPELSYEVSVLSEPEKVHDKNMLDAKKHGVIVKSGHKTGLLLPDLDGVDSVDDQIEIACQKAGIDPEREQIELYSFSVEKYSD